MLIITLFMFLSNVLLVNFRKRKYKLKDFFYLFMLIGKIIGVVKTIC